MKINVDVDTCKNNDSNVKTINNENWNEIYI